MAADAGNTKELNGTGSKTSDKSSADLLQENDGLQSSDDLQHDIELPQEDNLPIQLFIFCADQQKDILHTIRDSSVFIPR